MDVYISNIERNTNKCMAGLGIRNLVNSYIEKKH